MKVKTDGKTLVGKTKCIWVNDIEKSRKGEWESVSFTYSVNVLDTLWMLEISLSSPAPFNCEVF